MKTKEYNKALENFNKAINLEPNYEIPYRGLGWTHYYLGNLTKAKEYFNKAKTINPNFEVPI